MCGIAGFFGKNKHLPNNIQINECLNLMYNRGPDARGKILKKFENKSLLFYIAGFQLSIFLKMQINHLRMMMVYLFLMEKFITIWN